MKSVITAFKEHKEFKLGRYWDSNELYFKGDTSTQPHYADTVEIIVDHGVVGDIHIGGARYVFHGHGAYFIPPNTVHSMQYKKSDGYVTVMKIAVEPLKAFLDIETVLKTYGYVMDELPHIIPESANVEALANLFKNSVSLCEILAGILEFFGELVKAEQPHMPGITLRQNEDLRRLIEWAEQHYTDKPSLTDAAEVMGYNKNYFCRLFKEATGVTYLNYLNALRIDRACAELKKGLSVSEVCYLCGFESQSYFIKFFSRAVGVTPKKYVSTLESKKHNNMSMGENKHENA